MKQLTRTAGQIISLLALGAFTVTLVITARHLPPRIGAAPQTSPPPTLGSPIETPTVSVFDSPIETPTTYPGYTPLPPRMRITVPAATATLAPGLPPVPSPNDLTEPIRLTTRPGFRGEIAVSGDTVTWIESTEGSAQVIGYDLHTQTERLLSNLLGGKGTLRTSGRYVVWDESYATADRYVVEIRAYDMIQNEELILGEGELPDISGQLVIWDNHQADENSPLVLYNLSTKEMRRLPGLRGKGAYISGDWILYASHIIGTMTEATLHAYNIRTEESISPGTVYEPASPLTNKYMAIDGNLILWKDTAGQMQLYDLEQRTRKIVEDTQTYIAGRLSKGIVLGFGRAFDLRDNSTFRTIPTGPSHKNYAGELVPDYIVGTMVNDGETLVWTACRGGENFTCPTNEVFLARRKR